MSRINEESLRREAFKTKQNMYFKQSTEVPCQKFYYVR